MQNRKERRWDVTREHFSTPFVFVLLLMIHIFLEGQHAVSY
jgi:hypothetical protein